MIYNVFAFLAAASVFLTIALAMFFLTTRRGFKNENRLLAALLAVFSLQIVYSYVTSNYAYTSFLPWHKLIFILRQASLLTGPLIYLYVRSFLKKDSVMRPTTLLHFLPFVVVVTYLMIFYQYVDTFIIWAFSINLYDTILILTSNFFYMILAVWQLRAMNIHFRDFFRSLWLASHYAWLQMVLLGFIVCWIINLNSFAVYVILRQPWWCAFTNSIFALTVFLFLNAIMFVLLLKPDAYYVVTKYRNGRLTETEKREYLGKLTAYMDARKPYLDSELTLEALADGIGISPRILSQLINETYHRNFKGFLLEYRLKESMRMLADSKHHHLTVLEILYQVGFNSKSAFNNQFKQYTNLTPQEFRSQYIPSQQPA